MNYILKSGLLTYNRKFIVWNPILIMKSIVPLSEVVKPYAGILLDAYGVFWGGNHFGLLPGAQEAMKKLVDAGKIVGILSNSTQLAEKEMAKVRLHGLIEGVHYHFFLTSGTIAKAFFANSQLPFKTPKQKFWVLNNDTPLSPSHTTIFEGSGYTQTPAIEEADFIYIMVPQLKGLDQTEPTRFQAYIEKIAHHKLPMVCANPDEFAHEGNPPEAVVRQGSIAKIYESMGGTVFYIGKPYPLVYNKALQCFSERKVLMPKDILMIGDTPETDIRGANNSGMDSALILKTGIMADRLSKRLRSSMEALSPQDTPNFFIERLSYHVI